MFAIDKLDAFKEAMSTAYMPVSIPQPNSDPAGKTDFLKTLENKSAKEDPVEINGTKRPNKREDSYGNKHVEKNDDDSVNGRSKDLKEQNKKPTGQNEPEKYEKTIDKNDHKGQKQENATKQTTGETTRDDGKKVPKKTGKNDGSASVKKLLQKHQIKIEEIGDMKEDASNKFTESKTRTTGSASEKIVLNNLSPQKKEATPQVKTEGDEESSKEVSIEKKLMKELEKLEIKDEPVPLKTEPKTQKTQAHDNNTFTVLDQNGKQIDQIKEIQVKKVLNQQNMFEQYQGLRDKVTEGVENSIKFLMTNGESRVTMQLQPPELGKVEVELLIKDNQVTAKINTENIAVKEVILNNLDQLKSNLENAGTGVDKFEVEVGGFKNHFDQHFSGDGSGSNGKKENGNEGGGVEDPNEPMPGKIKNHQALSFFLGRSINVVI